MSLDSGGALGVYVLDVGQGDCTFVVGPGPDPEVLLFDCADAFVARRFVEDHEFDRIRCVLVSHLDQDHIKGIAPFIKWFVEEREGTLEAIRLDDDRAEHTQGAAELFAYALELEKQGKVTLPAADRGDNPTIVVDGEGWHVELILPTHALRLRARHEHAAPRPNLGSMALRIVRGDTVVLVGGDAPLGAWEAIEGDLSKAQVFRVPHHGGNIDEGRREWNGYDDLYERVAPEHALISVGTKQPFPGTGRHPIPVHVGSMHMSQPRIVCTQLTDRCHDVPLDLREEAMENVGAVGYDWRHRRAGATSEVPCAGSILVRLLEDGTLEVEPGPGGWHDSWIAQLEHPCCRQ